MESPLEDGVLAVRIGIAFAIAGYGVFKLVERDWYKSAKGVRYMENVEKGSDRW